MNIIPKSELAALVDSPKYRSDYVYMYPPRQAYKSVAKTTLTDLARRAVRERDAVNVYVHFPFCERICSYCNLYVAGKPRDDLVAVYIDRVVQEIYASTANLTGKRVDTIYLGGGTPSLLKADDLSRVLRSIEIATGYSLEQVPEVSLEVSPEAVDKYALARIREIGINRVNFGVQSTSEIERKLSRRNRNSSYVLSIVDEALSLGFSNVCVDLIYGLADQTDQSFRESVISVAKLRPQTVCAYALTSRPHTGYSADKFGGTSSEVLYHRYDQARELLKELGYFQENHVRYVRDARGGYLQKRNHWRGDNIVGFGAGARSYYRYCDIRSGYSLRDRRRTLNAYLGNDSSDHVRANGILLDREEQMRRSVILGLFDLDVESFTVQFGIAPQQHFGDEFAFLERKGLITIAAGSVRLTDRGRTYRDNVAQYLFSDQVREAVMSYRYDD